MYEEFKVYTVRLEFPGVNSVSLHSTECDITVRHANLVPRVSLLSIPAGVKKRDPGNEVFTCQTLKPMFAFIDLFLASIMIT